MSPLILFFIFFLFCPSENQENKVLTKFFFIKRKIFQSSFGSSGAPFNNCW